VKEILMVHSLEKVSVPVLRALDVVVLSVSPVFFHEDILTPLILDDLRASWLVSG
jgi:hypothetical protein